MRLKRRSYLRKLMLLAPFLLFGGTLQGQTGTSQGKAFHLGFLINASNENFNENTVHISTTVATKGVIEVPGTNYRVPFDIPANTSQVFSIPERLKPERINVKEVKAVRITTEEEVTVHAYNEVRTSSDATMVLPKQSLSENYFIHAFNNDDFREGLTANQILVVATEDNTVVEILPTADLINDKDEVVHPAGDAFQDTLNIGDQVAYHAIGNLSGTTVRVLNNDEDNFCQPVAVFVGHINSLVDDCLSADHLFNQMYPTIDWGKAYAIIPFETRVGGDVVQVMAAEEGTLVNYGNRQERLNRGERFSFLAEQPLFLSSNKKISVMQLSRGKDCDAVERGNDNADPFLLMLSPISQVIQNVNFNVPSNDESHNYFLGLMAQTDGLQVNLEGDDISNLFKPMPGNAEWSYANVPISQGPRSLISKNGIVGHLYGFGPSMSFGMALGADLGDFDIEVEDEQFGIVNDLRVCEASFLTFSAQSNIPFLKEAYTNFRWLIGDEAVLTGSEVSFQFDSAGVFNIQLIATKSGDNCSQLRTEINLTVIDDGIDGIIGPISVCPNALGINYLVENALPNYDYQWEVTGGEFTSSGTGITVDWGAELDNAAIKVTVISPEGCTEEVELPIRLNEFLIPATPEGPQQLCAEDLFGHVYTTAPATGSTYTWVAEGGQIISGQGSSQVVVNWNGSGCHRLFFTESTVVSDLCDGQSGVLEVEVFAPIALTESMTPVLCFGDSNGELELGIQGGLPPYTFKWSNEAEGSTLSNVPAGTYEVEVTDALGCVHQQAFTISSPEELLADVLVEDAVCNGERGVARLMVQGGTAPYVFRWNDGVVSDSPNRNDLSEGDYQVIISDQMGCLTELKLNVQEPAPLTADLSQEKACPDQSDGGLRVEVLGGTAPYTFIWEQEPETFSDFFEGISQGSYDLQIIDAAGCSIQLSGEVTNRRPLVKLPNVFTPNDDGINDTFGPVFNCPVTFEMFVYNSWGEMLFHTEDINEGWNAYFKGEKVQQGNYLYQARYEANFNGIKLKEQLSGKVRVLY